MILLLIYHIQSSSLNSQIGRDNKGITSEKKDQLTKENKNKTRELDSYSQRVDNTNDSINYNNLENNFDKDKIDDMFINSKEYISDTDRLGDEERRDCDVQGNNNTFCENSEKTSKADEYEDQPDYEIYNFKDSGIGESWLLGNDTKIEANAYINGKNACPVDIIVPRNLTNERGETKPVEVIGQYAYKGCGLPYNGKGTKTVLVTKQVKVIKYLGFSNMHYIESFWIEEGSVLQSIEGYGLENIGQTIAINDGKKRGTLTLPSTLSSVARNGIYWCNLFKVIIYCGNHSLTEECDLELQIGEDIKVKVTDQYSAETIFGRTPLKDSPTEVEGNCSQMALKPKPPNIKKDCSCSSLSIVLSPVFLSCFFLIDSDSDLYLQFYREVEEKRDSREGRRGSMKLSSLGVETEVFLVIKNRKKGHRRGVDQNQFSKFRMMNNNLFPNWCEG